MPDSLTMSDLQPYIDAGVVDYFGETSDVRDYIGQVPFSFCPPIARVRHVRFSKRWPCGVRFSPRMVPGCRETGRSRRERIFGSAGNADALAERMIWFIEHPGRIEEMAERSLELCREKYEIGRVNRTMLEIMERRLISSVDADLPETTYDMLSARSRKYREVNNRRKAGE